MFRETDSGIEAHCHLVAFLLKREDLNLPITKFQAAEVKITEPITQIKSCKGKFNLCATIKTSAACIPIIMTPCQSQVNKPITSQ